MKHVVRKEYAFDPRIDSTWERNTDVRVVEREPQLKVIYFLDNFTNCGVLRMQQITHPYF